VVNTTALLDPDVVIFGGGVCDRWPLFATELQVTIANTLRLQAAPRVELSTMGDDRGLWGALMLVPERVRQDAC
jgi:predicted NBD/HSP70 family sugar kinase